MPEMMISKIPTKLNASSVSEKTINPKSVEKKIVK
jgi:hypothetical protein